jgi:peroxiredoxin Q/BCP
MASAKKTKKKPSKPTLPARKAAKPAAVPATKTQAKPAPTPKPGKRLPATKPTKPAPATKLAKPAPVTKLAKPAPAKSDDTPSIGAGDRAPSFTLTDQAGKTLSSSALAGAPYVLYFYPKDDTTGCTKEACGFRDSFRTFGKQKARVIGVSPDSEASHARFAGKYGLPFTLLSDPDKKLASAYGVWAKKLNYGREYMGIVRSTFVVDAKGIVRKAWRGVKVDGHVGSVLEAVSALS